MKIGIICAMSSEVTRVASLLEDLKDEDGDKGRICHTGRLHGHDIILAQSGVGKVNAAVQATRMILAYRPQVILNAGVAGGIDRGLRVMDIVVGQQTAYHDVDCGPDVLQGQIQDMPPFFEADSRLYSAAMSVTAESRIHGGLICTGDQFITDPQQLARIKERYPDGLAVDMESAAFAQVCHIFDIPFLSFRIISDTPGVEGHVDQYFSFWDEMADRSFGVTSAFLEAICRLNIR